MLSKNNILGGFGDGNKIRVGFVFSYVQDRWIGGYNYFRNLIDAIMCLPGRSIDPVIFTGTKSLERLPAEFKKVEVIPSEIINRGSFGWGVRNISKFLWGKDKILERLLLQNNIQILSHSGSLGPGSKIVTLCWIPDFQHFHLPEHFSLFQKWERTRRFEKMCLSCSRIIVSSKNAQNDLHLFFPQSRQKSKVLNFVAKLANDEAQNNSERIVEKYNISNSYFHVPNQFWAHKNHDVLVEALKILKEKNKEIFIVATGNTQDTRKTGIFSGLMDKVKGFGLEDYFRVLGVVPYEDLMVLMKNAIALINPSYFEGWSSTVEEAKSMGKTILLSDIPIHREQNPMRGVFFDPDDPEDLAEKLIGVYNNYDVDHEQYFLNQAKKEFSQRQCLFAECYEKIVLEAYHNILGV